MYYISMNEWTISIKNMWIENLSLYYLNNKKGVLIEEEEKSLKDGQDAEADLMSSENLVG